MKTQKEEFDKWLFEVCKNISEKTKRDIIIVYSLINLTDAKLSFMEGILPNEYEI